MLNWQNLPPKYQYWLAVAAIKLRKLKEFTMSVDEVNELLPASLPPPFAIAIPAGNGSCRLIKAEVLIPKTAKTLHIELLTELHIEVMANPVYRAHVLVEVTTLPRFNQRELHIDLGEPHVASMTLLQDEYSLLKDGKSLMQQLLPSGVKGALELGVKTLGLVGGRPYQELQAYLNLYLGGNKQKVLDYHKADIQKHIEQLAAEGELHYELDMDVMEEKLFALYGKGIEVRRGELVFKL